MFLDFIASQLGFLEYNEGTSLESPRVEKNHRALNDNGKYLTSIL